LSSGTPAADWHQALAVEASQRLDEACEAIGRGPMPTAKDPAQLAALIADKVLPELRALA
jgi:hypothetical protein